MPIITTYLFVASMDVDPEKEALFNEVYDAEHVPNLLKVPGVHAVTRLKGEPFAVSIGGAAQQVAHTGPRYSALDEEEIATMRCLLRAALHAGAFGLSTMTSRNHTGYGASPWPAAMPARRNWPACARRYVTWAGHHRNRPQLRGHGPHRRGGRGAAASAHACQ
jgi:hypothetical protein